MGDLNAPGVADGTEHRLLVIPPDPAHFEAVVPAEPAGTGRGDAPIYEDQLEAPADALPGQVLQDQLAGPVLVGGGRHDQRTHREPGDVDGHDALAPFVRP